MSPPLRSARCREPGLAAGAGAIPRSQHQQPGPASVLRAFLRASCSRVLNPSLLLVQDSSLTRPDDKVNPDTAVVYWLLPGCRLSLYTHQTLCGVCWQLSQLSLSSIFQEGWQFRGHHITQQGDASLTRPMALLQPWHSPPCPWRTPSSC